jgi:branched-chain amino acid transport system ATP-binding protein
VLRITNLFSMIGRVEILKGVSLHVEENEIVTLLGANGAGKSTIINTIAGLIPAHDGSITFQGEAIAALSPMKIVKKGIALVPEGRLLFASLPVLDNLQLGAYTRYSKARQAEYDDNLHKVMELFPILRERKNQLAGTLSGGEQQMLAIARALMSSPKMILLDEPSMGLAPLIVEEIFSTIDKLRKQNLTVILVEQNARMALELADRGYVIETGQVVMEGDSEDLRQNKEIERAYLGKAYTEIWE